MLQVHPGGKNAVEENSILEAASQFTPDSGKPIAEPIKPRYRIDNADLSGIVSGQPPITMQFNKNNGSAITILPAVIAIG